MRPPLRHRFKAWWEGMAVEESAAEPSVETDSLREHTRAWDEARLQLAERVWGKGFVLPGDEAYLKAMLEPVSLNPSMPVLEVGAGAGGTAAFLAETYDVHVTALEPDPVLASEAKRLVAARGLTRNVLVRWLEAEEFKPESADCVISRDTFYLVEDKVQLLVAIEAALRGRGHLILCDYVRPDRVDLKALDAWRAGEPPTASPWTLSEYRKTLSELKLEIQEERDLTDELVTLVSRAWDAFRAEVSRSGLQGAESNLLVAEAELWARRCEALRKGILSAQVIRARKPWTAPAVDL